MKCWASLIFFYFFSSSPFLSSPLSLSPLSSFLFSLSSIFFLSLLSPFPSFSLSITRAQFSYALAQRGTRKLTSSLISASSSSELVSKWNSEPAYKIGHSLWPSFWKFILFISKTKLSSLFSFSPFGVLLLLWYHSKFWVHLRVFFFMRVPSSSLMRVQKVKKLKLDSIRVLSSSPLHVLYCRMGSNSATLKSKIGNLEMASPCKNQNFQFQSCHCCSPCALDGTGIMLVHIYKTKFKFSKPSFYATLANLYSIFTIIECSVI